LNSPLDLVDNNSDLYHQIMYERFILNYRNIIVFKISIEIEVKFRGFHDCFTSFNFEMSASPNKLEVMSISDDVRVV
jgi:hypothetical protein